MGLYSLLAAFALTLMVVLQGHHASAGSGVISACHRQCRAEEELKRICKLERNCQQYLPDFGDFLDCLNPCSQIGNNCFQRCAFKTDLISAKCLRNCRIDTQFQDDFEEVVLTPGDAAGGGEGTEQGDNSLGTLCYKACYDNKLNYAINRLYRKRP